MNPLIEKSDAEEIVKCIPYEKLEKKVILITGANGFLASAIIGLLIHLNKYHLINKCTIIALCRNRMKAEKKFKDYLGDKNFFLCIQNVEDKILLKSQVDFIVHAASNAVTAGFEKAPVDVLQANIIGTYNLLEFARTKQLNGFLFFSSGSVYGEATNKCSIISEEDYFGLDFGNYRNCYAEGKRAGEALCNAYWHQYNIPAKIVRISHTYGPGINLDDGRVFSDFVKYICQNKALLIKGSGKDIRPFCYISDAIIAFFLVLLEGRNGEVYNMANSKETVTIHELAEKLVYEAFPERRLEIKYKNKVSNNDVKKIEINIDKLLNLGWNPKIDIVEGFQRTVRSFEEKMI